MLSASLGFSGKLRSKLFNSLALVHYYFYCLVFCTVKLYGLAQQQLQCVCAPLNPSFTGGGGGVEPTPKGFSSITLKKNKLETPNFAQCNFNNIHIGGYDQIWDSSQTLGGG